MSNTLTVTKTLSTTGWTVTASLNSGSTIPREIFAYLNTGTVLLGDYQGVITPLDLARISIWSGSIVPVYGNKFVRTDTATISVPQGTDPDSVISTLTTSVQAFSTAFQKSNSNTTIYTII